MPRRPVASLRPAEVAEAAVLADLSVVLLFLGWLLPIGAILQILSVAPLAALAVRHRARVVVIAAVACSSVAFLVGGVGLWSVAVVISFVGLVVGAAMRRGWGRGRLALITLAVWAPLAGITVGQLLVFAGLRKLAIQQITFTYRGLRSLLLHFPFVGRVAALRAARHWLLDGGNAAVSWGTQHWWVLVSVGELLAIETTALVAMMIGAPAIRRLGQALGPPAARVPRPAPGAIAMSTASGGAADGLEPPAPLPLRFRDVSARYAGADGDALSGVNLDVPVGSLVAVVGPNGSGKSTLARVIAGMLAAEGDISRPGRVGLGEPGGTAVIFQRPESQVLGVRVRDDLVWGLPPQEAANLDIEAVLGMVGLQGMADEETSTLSGGQLQRLAIAAALARRPALLVADEATSMLDPIGRRQVNGVLRRLAGEHRVTVVNVTHLPEEREGADVVWALDAGEVRS